MEVRALRDHFHEGELRKEDEKFEYNGRAHRHIEPVDPKHKKAFEEDLKKVTAEQAKKKADNLAKATPATLAPPAAAAAVAEPPAPPDPPQTD
jgi:thiamine biosynthesis lipoprotein ApbE